MDLKFLLLSFDGRIRRLHYWLAAIGAGLVLGVMIQLLLTASGWPMRAPGPLLLLPLAVLSFLDIWIGLALGVKRCHDRDKSGWFLLIGLIPVIGALWLFIDLGLLDGTPGPNKYGPSPKGLGAAAAA